MTAEGIKSFLTDRGEKPLIFGLIAFLFVATALVGFISSYNVAYTVAIDGKQVALVADEGAAQMVLEELIEQKSQEASQAVKAVQEVTVEKTRVKGDRVTPQQLASIFDQHLSFTTAGTAIVINGEQRLIVQNKEVANRLLEQAKQNYLNKSSDSIEILELKIKESVSLQPVQIGLGEYTDYDTALKLLINGTEKVEKHIVANGESLWTIARANNMRVDDLLAANPQLSPNRLSIGEELNLVKLEPMVNVVASVRERKTESIPFTTKFINDSKMYRGQERVAQPGERGEREVIYELVQINGKTVEKHEIASNIVKKPVERVVNRGTRVIVASRGSGEAGKMGWPVSGRITSGYGNRSGSFHSGIDIAASHGTSIRAAAAGVVTFSGWSGNYGNMIDIDHGNGVVTRYAHNSANLVQVGQQVSAGEVIGRVGSTGRSTGPHVHFEVRVNGATRNPVNFLR